MDIGISKKNKKESVNEKAFMISNFLDSYYGLIILLIMFVLVGVAYVFLLMPKYNQVSSDINAILLKMVNDKKEITAYKTAIESYKSAYDGVSTLNKSRVNEMIGPSVKFPSVYKADLLLNLDTWFREHEFMVTSINISEPAKKKSTTARKSAINTDEDALPVGIAKMNVTVKVDDLNYNKLLELLDLLEHKLRLVDLNSLDCTEGIASCSFTFDTYFFEYIDA